MAEMEDKFQEILGNPAAMSQIMSIAQSLSATGDPPGEAESDWEPVEAQILPPGAKATPDSLEALMGGLDPAMMAMGMRLVSAYQKEGRGAGLMQALRPYMKEERHDMMDKLAQATKIAKVLCCLWEVWGEERGERRV